MSTAAMVLGSGIDAGGIDWIEKDAYNAAAVVAFPIYDGHGNMVATAGRVGSGFQNADPRSYDAWGGVRGGNTTGDPKQRYCANLGHVQDDESELIYMRARYYEPWTGRFVSEDPSREDANYFVYAANDPIRNKDAKGTTAEELRFILAALDQLLKNVVSGRMTQLEALNAIQNVIMRDLRRFARVAELIGLSEIESGAVQQEFSRFHGNLAMLSQKIGEIRVALGVEKLSFVAAAKIGLHLAECAMWWIRTLN